MVLVTMHIPLTLRKEFFKTTPTMVISFEIQILLEFPIPFWKGEHPDHFYLFEDLWFPLQLPFKLHKDNKPANNKD